MNIFALETRKKITKSIVETTSKFALYAINNKNVAGTLLLFFHCTFMGTLIFRMIKNIDYICTIIWVLIIYSNYYFNGCILSRIEQVVFNDKTWGGPISVLMYPLHLYYVPNKQIMNDYIKYFWCAPISTALFFKYVLVDDIFHKLIGGVLFILLMPLLFIHSQCNIFDYLLFIPETL
jgi:hypothetical protein